MSEQADPRKAGQELLRALAREFPPEAGVTEERMFSGRGLKTHGKFFAFISHAGDLGVKVAEADVQRLIADGQALPMTMGTRTMREWARISPSPDGDLDS